MLGSIITELPVSAPGQGLSPHDAHRRGFNRLLGSMLAAGLMTVTSAAMAQVVVLNGKSTIGADSVSGFAIRIVSANAGGARVSIKTDPDVALVCDDKTPRTTCYAYVRRGAVIRVALRRPAGPRTVPGTGTAPKPAQWAHDCEGTTGPDCTVTMDQPRTVFVDWAAGLGGAQ